MVRMGRLTMVVILGAMLLATGCTGLWRKQSSTALCSIGGQVTDEAGNPLAGIQVHVDTGQHATTDETGNFIITGVPVGSRQLIIAYFFGPEHVSPAVAHAVSPGTANKPFPIDELKIPWEHILKATPVPTAEPAVHTQTVYTATAGLTNVEVIVPNYGNVDALFMYQAFPPAGEPLPAGNKMDMQYAFTYSLSSDDEGAVGILVYYETPNGNAVNIAQPLAQRVTRGTGKVVITANQVEIPRSANVQVFAALITPRGTAATQSIASYPVQAGPVPIAPELQLIGYDDFTVAFRIGTQRPEGFQAYVLRRNTGQSPSIAQAVQTIDDTTTAVVFDTPPDETTYYYWLELITDPQQQQPLLSNRVKVPLSREGVYALPFAPDDVPAALLADPVRDVLYAAVPLHNTVQVISTVAPPGLTGVERSIGVGARPDQMAITDDGGWLFVTTPGNHSLTQIDLDTYGVTRWTGLRHVGGIAVHPDGDKLYVGINDPNNVRVQLYDIATQTLVKEQPVAAATALAVDRADAYLYAGAKEDNTVTVLNAATLTPVATVPSVSLGYHALPANSDTVFIGTHAIDTANWTVTEQTSRLPIALGDDDSFMFVLGPNIPGQPYRWEQNALYMLAPGVPQPLMRIVVRMREPQGKGAAFALSRDEKRLYVIEQPARLVYIDLEQRRTFGTS